MSETKRKLNTLGYILVWVGKDHNLAYGGGWALEHRVVMQAAIGRPLTRGNQVHHINGDRADNRIENLKFCETPAEHTAQHRHLLNRIHPVNGLPISRQRAWQLLKQSQGQCTICGEPLVNKSHCKKHSIQRRERGRQKYSWNRRNWNAPSYHLE